MPAGFDADLAIFLCDGRACPFIGRGEMQDIRHRLETDPDITEVFYESKAAARTRFQELYAHDPAFAASVGPAELPASFRLSLARHASPEDVMLRYAQLAGVEEVVIDPP